MSALSLIVTYALFLVAGFFIGFEYVKRQYSKLMEEGLALLFQDGMWHGRPDIVLHLNRILKRNREAMGLGENSNPILFSEDGAYAAKVLLEQNSEASVLPAFSDSLVGVVSNHNGVVALYSQYRMMKNLMEVQGLSEEAAYAELKSIVNTDMGNYNPVFMLYERDN